MKLHPIKVAENYTVSGTQRWKACTLFEHAKDLEPFDIPLAALPIGTETWTGIRTPLALAEEMRRVLDADLSHPIILNDEGFVMDGWHRVTKALIEGRTVISAVRFEKNPDPDYFVTED